MPFSLLKKGPVHLHLHLHFHLLLLLLLIFLASPWQRLLDAKGVKQPQGDKLLDKLLMKLLDISDPHECQQSLADVVDWIDWTLALDEAKQAAVVLADFENSINITEFNKNKAVELLTEFNAWFLGVSDQARKLLESHNESLSSCGGPWKRMLERYSMDGNLIPSTAEKRKLLNSIAADLESHYAVSEVEKDGVKYRLEPELTILMRDSRDYEVLLWAWEQWHDLAAESKEKFSEMVNLMNEAANEHGFQDTGTLWRISDLEDPRADEVLLRLMEEVRPLYEQLHAYVRSKLMDMYYPQMEGTLYEDALDPEGPIPAHLLGNMWAQEWSALGDILLPFPDAPSPPNVTEALLRQNYTVERMFRLAEEFFVSLGFQPLTDVFWRKSVVRRPEDPSVEMVCHASAYDMVSKEDYRIKMCTEINSRDFETIHHEMGHVVYYMEYRKQPFVFRSGGNPAFHEAVGDTIGLSVMSQKHLEAIGLAEKASGESRRKTASVRLIDSLKNILDDDDGDDNDQDQNDGDNERSDDEDANEDDECDDGCKIKINKLMTRALDKIVFLPFAISLELWRYGVFNGSITPEEYTSKWWELREKYQGIKPPVERTSDKFDPGAKFHIVANVPYARYFYSFIGQFQFHEALCSKAGHRGELYNCDIYKSKKAGNKLRSMLSEGASRPWRELMKNLTGIDEFDARSVLDYFKPLHLWLIKENKGRKIGWSH